MGDVLSEIKELEIGVTQGSVLYVTLFNIKINDIVKTLIAEKTVLCMWVTSVIEQEL